MFQKDGVITSKQMERTEQDSADEAATKTGKHPDGNIEKQSR